MVGRENFVMDFLYQERKFLLLKINLIFSNFVTFWEFYVVLSVHI